ncbi:hypothetical protein RchiOBHm_Chr2g0138221 [Rosa chinensis]|uniref:Uncharacterized protein n=1 Tax=Rosa chinensis TaxID=74649 RepID=A0A2P6RWV1_ROSCH|nr:hypothetical protein RchiOBHm_Chr2g0138221 [Rosa chinensis]
MYFFVNSFYVHYLYNPNSTSKSYFFGYPFDSLCFLNPLFLTSNWTKWLLSLFSPGLWNSNKKKENKRLSFDILASVTSKNFVTLNHPISTKPSFMVE